MPETYTVKAGDSLSKIAIAQFGDMNRWRELAELNKITNPNLIKVGQVLLLPKTAATPVLNVPPAPTDEIPDIVNPGTGQSTMTVTATKFPSWLPLLGIIAVLYFFSRKR